MEGNTTVGRCWGLGVVRRKPPPNSSGAKHLFKGDENKDRKAHDS